MDVQELVKLYKAGERDFFQAELLEAELSGADLSNASLSEANLGLADLSGANLSNTDLSEAQQMMAQLNALAHNLIVWSRRWLAQTWDKVENLGILRMVRDVFHLSGLVHFRSDGSIERITLHQADPFASGLCAGLPPLLAPVHVAVSLGEI